MRVASRSTAVTRAPAAASCAVLPPGAAPRSATRSPGRAASSRAGGMVVLPIATPSSAATTTITINKGQSQGRVTTIV